mmetsp:Transcript_65346/g.181265  ORF Transcript_65346/g.181265 Transcript_65346/m.181265 type:complete len:111 (-) Transcript_65346:51-383(-)
MSQASLGPRPMSVPGSAQSLGPDPRSLQGAPPSGSSTMLLPETNEPEDVRGGATTCGANPRLSKEQVESIKKDKWLTVAKQVDECSRRTYADHALSILACACLDRRSLRQ